MWFFLLFLLTSETDARLCSTHVELVCKPPEHQPEVIPGSEQELHALCPVLSDHLECLNSYDLACYGRSRYTGVKPPMNYVKIRAFLDEACEEKTTMHKVLTRSLPCIKNRAAISDLLCRDDRSKVINAYKTYLDNNPSARKTGWGSENNKVRTDCLNMVFTASCVLKDIEKECGFLAYEVGMAAVKNTQILTNECGLEVFEELSEAIPNLKLKKELKDFLEEYFKIQ